MAMFGSRTPAPSAFPELTLDGSVPVAPPQAQQPARGGLFGAKGSRQRDMWGAVADWLSMQGGGPAVYGPGVQRDRERTADEQHEMALLRMKQEMEGSQVQGVALGNGGYGTFSPNAGLNVLREPTASKTARQQDWDFMQSLPKEQQPQFRSMMPGYGYTAEGQEAQQGMIDYRNTHRPPAKVGSGGNIHGRSKSNPIPVNSREALEAQAPGTWVSLPNGTVTQRR